MIFVAFNSLLHLTTNDALGECLARVREHLAPAVDEPAFDARNCTFCLWRRTGGAGWEHGPVEFPDGDDADGSALLLGILDGRPESYRAFAADYYEVDLPLAAVAAVYAHEPLTPALIARLNADASIDMLGEDVAEIGYPDPGRAPA
jgi:hypothetical protein